MDDFTLHRIGEVSTGRASADTGEATVTLDAPYRDGLKGLSAFSHVNVLFWCHQMDNPEYRGYTVFPKVYRTGPDEIGVFATRSPVRPNPVALTACKVRSIDEERGTLTVTGLDAEDGSPVIDVKPYLPSEDRVRDAGVPEWCGHWPSCVEESAEFDWSNELLIPGEST